MGPLTVQQRSSELGDQQRVQDEILGGRDGQFAPFRCFCAPR